MKMLFEVKTNPDQRPFTFNPGTKQPIRSNLASQNDTYAQIISYATEAQLYQHRDFYYTVYVWQNYARLMRWDRAGVVLSEPFDWVKERKPLLTFMYAFAMATPQDQGYSSHARRATKDEVSALQKLHKAALGLTPADAEAPAEEGITKPAREDSTDAKPAAKAEGPDKGLAEKHRLLRAAYFAEMLRDTNKWPVHKITCVAFELAEHTGTQAQVQAQTQTQPQTQTQVEAKKETKTKVYWVGKYRSISTSRSPTGRCTKTYVAYDFDSDSFAFFKDSWCAAQVTTELANYKAMDEAFGLEKSNSIPTILASNGESTGVTRSQEFVENLRGRSHQLLVMQEIGRPLEEYKSQLQLVRVMADAMEGHRLAYEEAGILHRDVSANNIVIREDGRGMLIDWDMTRPVAEIRSGASQSSRSGTWMYMSALLTVLPWKWNELADDLESFLHILCVMALRFHLHDCSTPLPITPEGNAANGPLIGILETYLMRHDGSAGMIGSDRKLYALKGGDPHWELSDEDCGIARLLQKLYHLFQQFHKGVNFRTLRHVSREGSLQWMCDSKFRFSQSPVFDSHVQIQQAFNSILQDDTIYWPLPSEKTGDQFEGLQTAEGRPAVTKDNTYASASVQPLSAVLKRGRSPSHSEHNSAELPVNSRPHKKAKRSASELLSTHDWVDEMGSNFEWGMDNRNWDAEVLAYDSEHYDLVEEADDDDDEGSSHQE
ncbi:hypothetical protein BC628DRAFT_1359612 [Trametes gibbosa]|nr:hypothetical protein BC628DRAFT_1359612 [Trametes gibbosa]